jgi:hypothetical protein
MNYKNKYLKYKNKYLNFTKEHNKMYGGEIIDKNKAMEDAMGIINKLNNTINSISEHDDDIIMALSKIMSIKDTINKTWEQYKDNKKTENIVYIVETIRNTSETLKEVIQTLRESKFDNNLNKIVDMNNKKMIHIKKVAEMENKEEDSKYPPWYRDPDTEICE